MENMIIPLALTLDETTAVLTVLAQRPYAEVFQIIAKIQTQAKQVIDEAQKPPEAPKD